MGSLSSRESTNDADVRCARSLVLEMPIREACHVALQRQPEGAPPAWRHTRERHQKNGGGGGATLQVVSFGADLTDRAPTFDMDLKDLFDPSTQKPISYKAANAFFQQDPARSWVSARGPYGRMDSLVA